MVLAGDCLCAGADWFVGERLAYLFLFIDDGVMWVMSEGNQKESVWFWSARMVYYFFACLGALYVIFFGLYWWFFDHSCMVDCMKSGYDKETCQVEICKW